jgi:hypothetical protein
MMLVMFGITAALLGVSAILLQQLQRPPATAPEDGGRRAALAVATVIRDQALRSGVPASGLDRSTRIDGPGACRGASRAAGPDVEVVSCGLTAAGVTVVTAWRPAASAARGQSFSSAVVGFVDIAAGCMALRPSWGPTRAPVCDTGQG